MLTAPELCNALNIRRDVLDHWIAEGWLSPVLEGSAERYGDIDIARAQLILELIDEFDFNDNAIGIVIDLVDQIHGLRLALRHVLAAR